MGELRPSWTGSTLLVATEVCTGARGPCLGGLTLRDTMSYSRSGHLHESFSVTGSDFPTCLSLPPGLERSRHDPTGRNFEEERPSLWRPVRERGLNEVRPPPNHPSP